MHQEFRAFSTEERLCFIYHVHGHTHLWKAAADCSALCGQLGSSEARSGTLVLTTTITDWPEETEDILERLVQCQQIKQNPI